MRVGTSLALSARPTFVQSVFFLSDVRALYIPIPRCPVPIDFKVAIFFLCVCSCSKDFIASSRAADIRDTLIFRKVLFLNIYIRTQRELSAVMCTVSVQLIRILDDQRVIKNSECSASA